MQRTSSLSDLCSPMSCGDFTTPEVLAESTKVAAWPLHVPTVGLITEGVVEASSFQVIVLRPLRFRMMLKQPTSEIFKVIKKQKKGKMGFKMDHFF